MTMPRPHESRLDDQQLVQYLLGLLPPEDAERLDEASIADDEVAARLRLVEEELVDAYVRGRLAGETLKRFESHYLSSPRRRERVAFAGRFLPAVDQVAVSAGEAGGRHSTGSRWTSWLALAAALLLAACGALLFQTVRLDRGLSVVQSERGALDRRARELEQQLTDLRAANATVAKELQRVRESMTTAATQDAPAIALLLLPQTRSIGPIPTLSIPPGTDRVGFELRLESNDFPRYQVGLRDPAVNKIVWRSGWIAAKSSGGQPSVLVALPAGVLRPQHYSLDLTGRGTAGGAEVVGSYAFEVVPR
jgi:hypothetical protein